MPASVVVVGKIGHVVDYGWLTENMEKWWESAGRKYPDIHLLSSEDIDAYPFLEFVDFTISWNWQAEGPVAVFIYQDKKEICSFWQLAWPFQKTDKRAFQRAIRFLNKWLTRPTIEVQMPKIVPGYRMQQESEAIN